MNEETPASIHTICRTCLSNLQHDEAFDLFVVPGLAKKLCVCTSLSVEHLDGFPRNLCTTCHSRLNDLHDFQKQCVESVQRFKELMSRNTFIIQTMPEDDVVTEKEPINFDPLLNTKMEIDNEEDVFKMLEDVDKESDDVDNLEDAFNDSGSDYNNEDADFQVDSSDSDDEMPLSRLRSNSKTTKSKAKKDDEEQESSESNDEDDPKEKPKRKRIPAAERHLHRTLECHICRQRFKKASRYEEHMKHHNDQLPFQCTVETCKKGFTTAAGLRHHMDHTHPELCELIPCTVAGCEESFPRTRMLTHHLKKVHKILKPEIRSHPCTECDKVFRCPTALKKHMYKHTGEEPPISCNICNKRFFINSELRDHLLRHAGVKNHVCPYCGVGKTTRQEWNKHILTHTREKQFQCRQCDHASHNKQALANHVKVVHMKIKNFACQYCGKTFGKSHACKIHERLHTGENCCECKICGKVFLFEKRLTKHLQLHEKRDIPAEEAPAEADAQKEQLAEPIDVKKEPTVPVKPKVPAKPKKSRRVERVDISQLAGTSVNPIPSVSVPSWSPQVNFTKKEGQHICPGCGRGFNHIGNMKLHYKVIHEKIKDFACRYCPKRFGKAQYLQHHEYTHTGEKPYGCKICDKHFSHGSSLRKHMFSHNRPPKAPKAPKPPPKTKEQMPKLKLNKQPAKNYEQYQDPAAERAAATAELMAQQLDENEAKRRAEEKTREIQEAACQQLQKLQQQQISYDSFAE
ncbi:zinc finger protein 420-like [Drosophila innubila]|uniref:zinc finger protein 420-like n=1 Tax=Drosophila innubila TaxID=198719 RepID=UPI00148C77E8|nr:zinc finger protein 420-like [Drosophila innubila]